MMIGTSLMALTPGYATIGIAAPILITSRACLQGFSVGGEFGSAVSFLAEHAGPRARLQRPAGPLATGASSRLLASLFGVALTTLLDRRTSWSNWGWRIPYFFGLLVGPAGSTSGADGRDARVCCCKPRNPARPLTDLSPPLSAGGCCWRSALSIISNARSSSLYIPTYGVKTSRLPHPIGFTATLVGGVDPRRRAARCRPLVRQGRPLRPLLMVVTCWLFLMTPYPVFYLMAGLAVAGDLRSSPPLAQLVKAGYSGVLPSLMSDQFRSTHGRSAWRSVTASRCRSSAAWRRWSRPG